MIRFTLILFLFSCTDPQLKVEPKTIENIIKVNRFPDNNFSLELIPDTTKRWPTEHQAIGSIINQKVVVARSGNLIFLTSSKTDIRLWPSNFPEILIDNDTLMVSGEIYGIPGSEKMPGEPFLINKIYAKTTYRKLLY